MNRLRKSSFRFVRLGSHRSKLLVLGGVFVIFALATGAFMTRSSVHAASSSNIVILSFDHTSRTIPTQASTVGELLGELGIKINQGDVVEPALKTEINQDEFRVNIYRARPVVIIDGTHKTYTFSAAASPRAVAEQAGLTVYPEDDLTVGPVNNFVTSNAIGEQLTIARATPVTLVLYGNVSTVRTQAKTVGEFIAQKGIKLVSGDTLEPAADTPLTSGLTIAVAHQGVKFATVTEAVPAPVQYIEDANLTVGTSAVRQQGSDGEREVTYKITTRNGQEIDREAIQSVVITDPVVSVVAVGTHPADPSANAAAIWEFLRAQGFSPNQTAGIMGNLKQEHGFLTSGDGLAQWSGGRRANLMSQPEPYSLQTQLNYLMGELNGGYSSAKAAVLSSQSVEAATLAFQNQYEHCNPIYCNTSGRISFAYGVLNEFN